VRIELFSSWPSCLLFYRYHGGWLAPNIYYLGGSGCVRLNGIRIAGASGIFKRHDYNLGHFEQVPYNNSTLRSVYHVRAYDVFKLSLLTPGLEVMTSHDWPEGIYNHGDTAALLRTKPWFQDGINKKDLGNPHMMTLMKTLRPHWWFSAHMHVRFQTEYDHTVQGTSDGEKTQGGPTQGRSPGPSRTNTVKNPDEIVIDEEDWGDEQPTSGLPTAPSMLARNKDETVMDDDDYQPVANAYPTMQMEEKLGSSNNNIEPATVPSNDVSSSPSPPSTTKFLALDKCLPERKFLEVNL
jgi:lariat debranching enzyme